MLASCLLCDNVSNDSMVVLLRENFTSQGSSGCYRNLGRAFEEREGGQTSQSREDESDIQDVFERRLSHSRAAESRVSHLNVTLALYKTMFLHR